MDRLGGKLIHNRLNLTSCSVVITTASRRRTSDPQRRNENEPLFLLNNLSPGIYRSEDKKPRGNDTTNGLFSLSGKSSAKREGLMRDDHFHDVSPLVQGQSSILPVDVTGSFEILAQGHHAPM